MVSVGRYTLLGEVGRGGAGVVHRALAPDGTRVALKQLHPGTAAAPHARARFAAEVQALLRLRHPGVVALLDAGEAEGAPFLVMEWVEGQSLAARLERGGPLDPRQAAELVRRLALALAHCHAQGVLHRDLKPENVLLRAGTGEPLLTDFGLARALDRGASRTALTLGGQMLGTPGFWAPEQARGELEQLSPRTDVYGLGGLLYAALTGRAPNAGQSLLEVLDAMDRDPAPPSSLRAGIPAALDAICLRALARSPAGRQPSAAAVAEALAGWQAPRRAGPPRAALLLGGGLALLGLAALGWRVRSVPPRAGSGEVARVDSPTHSASPADPTPAVPADREAALLHGALALRSGDPARAGSIAEALLARSPGDLEALRLRAAARLQALDGEGASRDYRRLSSLAPTPEDWLGLSRAIGLGGDLAAAADPVLLALKARPGWPEARLELARLRLQVGNLTGAGAELDALLAAEPGALEPLRLRLKLGLRVGDLRRTLEDAEALLRAPGLDAGLAPSIADLRDQARTALDMADRGDPGPGLVLTGWSALEAGDLRSAQSMAEDLLRAAPELTVALELLAELQFAQGQPEAAWDTCARLLARTPDAARALAIRARLRLDGDSPLDEAEADAHRAVELAPEDPWTLLALALARERAGRVDEARALCDRGLRLAPDHALLRIARSSTRARAKDLQGALADAVEATSARPDLGAVWIHRAAVRLVRGELEAAERDLQRGRRLAPDNPVGLAAEAQLLWRGGLQDQALELLDRALQARPHLLVARRTRATLREARGDLAGAREDLEELLRRWPDDPEAGATRRQLERLGAAPR